MVYIASIFHIQKYTKYFGYCTVYGRIAGSTFSVVIYIFKLNVLCILLSVYKFHTSYTKLQNTLKYVFFVDEGCSWGYTMYVKFGVHIQGCIKNLEFFQLSMIISENEFLNVLRVYKNVYLDIFFRFSNYGVLLYISECI